MASNPFPLPQLSLELEGVRRHWLSLLRGGADMPFWDDFAPSQLGAQAARSMLLDVFDKPLRFRFNAVVGEEIAKRYGEGVSDRFVDEIAVRPPFDFLGAQASATLECRAPTYFKSGDHARLILPMWGDGRISMLLTAFAWT